MNFFYAEPGGPPEYKQLMAEHEASPHPDPIKNKFKKKILFNGIGIGGPPRSA